MTTNLPDIHSSLPAKLDKRSRGLVSSWDSATAVPHIGPDEVQRLIAAARAAGRGHKGERDALLIQVLFDGCLRVSEALALTPNDLIRTPTGGWRVLIHRGKGGRPGQAAISPETAAALLNYIRARGLKDTDQLFPITRKRAHQLCQRTFDLSGVRKPAHVGACHVLRHSGALSRLRVSGNPRALQVQLRHRSAAMTLRYLKTLTDEEALKLEERVDVWG